MSVHAFVQRAPRDRRGLPSPADGPAWALLRERLGERHFAPWLAAAEVLRVPAGFGDAADLVDAAAAAVAETFGLLDPARASAARALVTAGLDGAADPVLSQAGPDAVLAWCVAVAEWCERNGLDHAFARLAPRAAAAEAGAATWLRVHWRLSAAWHHESFGRLREVDPLLREAMAQAEAADAQAASDRAEEAGATDLADGAGLTGLQVGVALARARLSLSRSVPDDAEALAQQAAAHADEATSPLWLAHAADVCARAALMRGDMHRAVHQSRRAQGLAAVAQAVPAYTFTYRVYEGYALLGLGAWDDAVALMRGLAALPLPPFLAGRVALMADLSGLVRDDRVGPWDAGADARLADALRRLRELDWPGVLAVLPAVIARLWARALEAGIETDWVCASIVARDLAPPEPAWPDAWPWPVRIRLLGPFGCRVGTRELADADGGKAAAKPLALLRRVAAEGGYEGVAAEAVAAALWPGEGREGRDKALETTLARLRKLLGHADAVLLHERRLRLNPRRVWLDTAALARRLDRVPGPDERDWAEALALWRGMPLADEDDAPWLAAWRRRWRQRLAAALCAASLTPGHRARCLRATAADPGLAPLV